MKTVIILALVITVTLGQDAAPPEPPVTTSSTTTTSTTTHTTITTPTTTTTKTTTTSPTTTTQPTTTPTTTSSTTTASTTKASTTTAPTKPTTTTATPITTAKPKPKEPEVLNFTIADNKNNTCILLKSAFEFKVSYLTNKNKTSVAEIMIPKGASFNGTCGEKKQSITIIWSPDEKTWDNITVEFLKNETKKNFMVSKVFGTLAIENYDFPDSANNDTIAFVHTKKEFVTPLEKSYKCSKAENFDLSVPSTNDTKVTLILSSLQLEAFANKTTNGFSAAEDCEFDSSGIVPIAVGCSLAALIIIILVTYLLARRRSQARGYLSM